MYYFIFLLLFSSLAKAQEPKEIIFKQSVADYSQFATDNNKVNCELIPVGFYLLSENSWFLFGKIKCDNSYFRSFLLTTQDSGLKWKEPSLEAKELSSANILEFGTPAIGYLVIANSAEGPGPEYLYTTKDSGASWKFVSELDKGKTPWRNTVNNFEVKSPKNICFETIEMLADNHFLLNKVCSKNGGKTWAKKSPTKKVTEAALNINDDITKYYKTKATIARELIISEEFIKITNKPTGKIGEINVQIPRKIAFEKIAKLVKEEKQK